MTTSVGDVPGKAENTAETPKEHGDLSAVVTTQQIAEAKNETVAEENKSVPADESQEMEQGKETTEANPPLSPTGSLHSESGESGTGVRVWISFGQFDPICPLLTNLLSGASVYLFLAPYIFWKQSSYIFL